MKIILSIIGILVVLALGFGIPAAATEASDYPSATNPPPGYTPIVPDTLYTERATPLLEQATLNSNVEALLIEDLLPWGKASIEGVFSELGVNYDLLHSWDLSTIDLNMYRFIVYPSDQPTSFYQNIQTNISKIESFVSVGGLLIAHVTDAGWNLGDWRGLHILPGNVGHSTGWDDQGLFNQDLEIADPSNAIIKGTPAGTVDIFALDPNYFDGWGYSTHGYLHNLPVDSNEVIRIQSGTGAGKPTYIDYDFGGGKVLATMQTVEWGYGTNGSDGYSWAGPRPELLRNEMRFALAWEADTAPPAAVTDLRPGFFYPTGKPPNIPEDQRSYGYDGALTYYKDDEGNKYAGWLARWPRNYPFENRYHIGQDIPANEGDDVYAIADGVVTDINMSSSWGTGNIGVVVKHKLNDGTEFLALYGHVHSNVSLNDHVEGGKSFATIGPFSPPHLHFGIHPGLTMPQTNWGRMPLSSWPNPNAYPGSPNGPDTNGFVDPIEWIMTRTAKSPISPASSVMLTWTAPANDGNDVASGPASEYDIRYSTQEITEANWESATQCTEEPAPGDPGSTDTFRVTDLSLATVYYFTLRAYDGAGNLSGLSNVARGVTAGIYLYLCSSADMIVTDPDGFNISKELNEIPGATYLEVDINGDGDPDDQVTIPDRKMGNYLVTVIPEPGASPTDTYTLGVSVGGVTMVLAEDVQIGDIPSQGYIIRSTESEITNWDYFFEDPTRGTRFYINTTNQTFQFIAPDKEFSIKKATRMKVIDISKEAAVKYDRWSRKWKIDDKKFELDNDLKPWVGQCQYDNKPEKIILIYYQDKELKLSAIIVDGKEDSCMVVARDLKTKKVYLLIDRPHLKRHIK
jgi:murein DD-endopeptidase MepM/ murein hydrolase activator NlpD